MIKKTIGVVTATRAEYGLLRNLIFRFKEDKDFELKILVTGMHLSPEFGNTYKEIENDGIEIAKKIPILLSGDDACSVSKTMGLAMIGFGEYFADVSFDALIALGDRYEILPVCLAAMNAKIPIIHLCGGDTTEGAIDEGIRHSITKLSYLHFTNSDESRKRVIQLGEEPSRVFTVGSMGLENIRTMSLLTQKELEGELKFSLGEKYAVVTYHPVTLDTSDVEKQVNELIKALDEFKDMNFIITKANADAKGRTINALLECYAKNNSNIYFCDSLGSLKYLSSLKYASMVIGNSSSGISEAPSFGIPTINIGNRQRGRMQGDTIINCDEDTQSIISAIQKALLPDTIKMCKMAVNPYGDGKCSEKMHEIIRKFISKDIDLKKKFYDLK